MLEYIEKMKHFNTISKEDMELFLVTDSIEEAITMIKTCINKYGLTHLAKKPSWILGEKR
jgi:predicted Rossmann-fold nucleotide-binding protein